MRRRELSRSFRRSERCQDSQGHNLDKSCWSKKFLFSLEVSTYVGPERGSAIKWISLRTPSAIRRSVRAGHNNGVAVRIAHPALPMIRTAVAVRRISMPRLDDFSFEFGSVLEDSVEVIHFEPEQNAVSIGLVIRVANRTVIMLDFEVVQLEYKTTI